jgi:hypothetical protein
VPDIVLSKQEDFPEGLREHAKQTEDGKGFVVNVVPKASLDEFRNNNITLKTQQEALTAKLQGFTTLLGEEDLEKAKTTLTELRTIAQQVKDGKLKGSAEITAEIERRTADMKTGYETQLRELGKKVETVTAERDGIKTEFDRSKVDQLITGAVLAEDSGVNPAALSDVLTRARNVYRVKEGKVVAMDGDTVIYGADGVTPLPPKEWLAKVIAEAPYLAKQSAGGGAAGGGASKGAGGFNSPEFKSLKPQERLKQFRAKQG